MAIDKKLRIFDAQGNEQDYDIMATDVKFLPDGKDLPTKLAEMEQEIGEAGQVNEIIMNGQTYTPTNKVINLGTVITQHQDISGKVDKVIGKGLSTNDFTDAEQTKLAGIAAGAQVNTINSIQTHDGTPLTPQNGIVTLPEQTEVDLSDYYDKDEVDNAIDEKLTEVTVNAVGNSSTMYFAGSALCIASENLIQVTATPTITYVDNEQNVVVSVSGSGTLKAYLDGVEQTLVNGSFTIAKTSVAQSVVVTATAKEEGKAISAEASLTIVVGSYVDTSKYIIGYSKNNNPFNVTLAVTVDGSTTYEDYPVVFDGTKTDNYFNWYVDISAHLQASSVLTNKYLTGIFGQTTSNDNAANVVALTQIPEGIASIGAYALMQAGSMVEVVLPSTVTELGTRALRNCNKLKTLECKSTTPPSFTYSVSNNCLDGCTALTTIVVPDGSKTAYQTSLDTTSGNTLGACLNGIATPTIKEKSEV